MSNEIKNVSSMEPRRGAGVTNRAAPGGSTESSPGKPASGPAGSADSRVTLTEAARKLARLSSESGAAAPVDEARVASLRAALAGGSYQPDPLSIATALLRLERDGG